MKTYHRAGGLAGYLSIAVLFIMQPLPALSGDALDQLRNEAGQEEYAAVLTVPEPAELRFAEPAEPDSAMFSGAGQSVVEIIMRKHWWKRTMFIDSDSQGTGFIIDSSGLIITNQHVVSGHDKDWDLYIRFRDGKKMKGRLLTCDGAKDWAVIKVDSKRPLPYLNLGESSSLREGDRVCTIGHPYGYKWREACGSVLRLPDSGSNPFKTEWSVMTDIKTWAGNSGGPLLNMRGEVVGIVASVARLHPSLKDVAYAIPIDRIKTCSLSDVHR
ncbi:MAG: S1C family serine protease [bacterium]